MIENSEGVVRVSLIRWERNLKAEGRYNLQDDTNLVCERGGEERQRFYYFYYNFTIASDLFI